MALPTPQQFADVVISESDAVCDQLQKLVTLSKLVEDVYNEIYDSSGNLTTTFLDKVCDLDCTGTGGPGGGATTTTTTTTAAPAAAVDTDIYTFQTLLSGGSQYSKMQVIDGANYDLNATVNFNAGLAIATLPSNRVVATAALHPVTGALWVLHYDGTLGAADTDLYLATMDTSTGVMSSAVKLNDGGGGNYDGLTLNRLYRIVFDTSDNSLWLMIKTAAAAPGILYTVATGTAVTTLVGTVGNPTEAYNAADDFVCDHDGTFYIISRGSSTNRISSLTKTVDPLYPGYLTLGDQSVSITSSLSESLLVLRANRFAMIPYQATSELWLRTDAETTDVFTEPVITATRLATLVANVPDLTCTAHLAT